jgi:release factor glutamine methyltransferase
LREATDRLRESGSESPRLDAELLLGHVLHIDRTSLIAHPEATVGPGQREGFERALERRFKGEPVAYIRGLKEFYGLALSVDRRALIPRPETELLVELGLDRLRRRLVEAPRPADAPPIAILDVGTGSGAVILAVAVEAQRRGYLREVRLLASEQSSEALSLAVENAALHGLAEIIEFSAGDLLEAPRPVEQVDLLLANLPYIPTAVVPELPVAASFEPRAALDGGEDGLAVIRRLLPQLPAVLAPAGLALLEIGAGQAAALSRAVEELLPGWPVTFHADLAGIDRVAELQRPDSR